jgi:uncharacterized protein YndB with AHSA1/START domain
MNQQVSTQNVAQNRTEVEQVRPGAVVTRTFDAPPHMVFKVWSEPDIFRRWWVPSRRPEFHRIL